MTTTSTTSEEVPMTSTLFPSIRIQHDWEISIQEAYKKDEPEKFWISSSIRGKDTIYDEFEISRSQAKQLSFKTKNGSATVKDFAQNVRVSTHKIY